MRPVPAPLYAHARPPGREERQGQLPVDLDLDDRLRFERLLTDLSATFVNVAANALARKRADHDLHAREESLRKTQDDLRLLAGSLLRAQDDERRRIAREIHDDWTQWLVVLAIDAAKLETQLDPSSNAHR
jgi:signal transduction histidine kinase